jgi:hypothetical protein
MRVAIAQVDGKWPNLALAKLAAHHSAQGHDVAVFEPLFTDTYDIVYASKVFVDTPDNAYIPDWATRGGIGYDPASELDGGVEDGQPDWTLWPDWSYDMGFTTRGCVRRCGFCYVPRKEGHIRVVAQLGDIWTGRRDIYLLDNNATAAPIDHFRRVCRDASEFGVRLSFCQGLDARLLTDEHAAILADTPLFTPVYMAFDNMADESHVRRAVDLLAQAGVRPGRVMVYVLTGYNTTPDEDRYRVELLRGLGCDPFAMRYDRHDRYQMDFARWVNRKELFKSCTFEDYTRRLGRAMA